MLVLLVLVPHQPLQFDIGSYVQSSLCAGTARCSSVPRGSASTDATGHRSCRTNCSAVTSRGLGSTNSSRAALASIVMCHRIHNAHAIVSQQNSNASGALCFPAGFCCCDRSQLYLGDQRECQLCTDLHCHLPATELHHCLCVIRVHCHSQLRGQLHHCCLRWLHVPLLHTRVPRFLLSR